MRTPAWVWITPDPESPHYEVNTRKPRFPWGIGHARRIRMSKALWTEYKAAMAACERMQQTFTDLYEIAPSNSKESQ